MDQQNSQCNFSTWSPSMLNPHAQNFIPCSFQQQPIFQCIALVSNQIQNYIISLQSENQQLQSKNRQLQNENQQLMSENRKLRYENENIMASNNNLVQKNQNLQHQAKKLDMKVDDMKQKSLDDQIRITGITKDSTKTLRETVVAIVKETDLDINEDIKKIHTENSKQKGKNTIIVQLKSTNAKNKVLKSAKKLAGVPKYKNVSINPNLTPKRHYIKIKAHMEVKKGNIKGSWVWKSYNYMEDKDGNIHKIFTMEDLNKFTDGLNFNNSRGTYTSTANNSAITNTE